MNNNPIYVVTVFTKCTENKEYGILDLGETRTIGFLHDLTTAKKLVESNSCDIWETCYTYAIVEEIEPGFYPISTKNFLYKFNIDKNIYEEIPIHKFMNVLGII